MDSSRLPPLRPQIFDSPQNPFVVPQDDEILNFQDMRYKQKQERRHKRNLKVWEKGVSLSRVGALRRIEQIEMQASPQQEKITVAQAAHAALVTDRVRARQGVQKTIEKKREMFLLQMLIDIKKQEIKKLQQFSLLREYGLKNSEDMLLEDMNRFNQYWDDCKRQSHDAMKQAKKLNKQKMDVTHDINKLNQETQHINNQIQKHRDNLDDYNKYREFLQDIIPNEQTAAEYFTSPELLLEIFDNLVEQNLLLIQSIQEIQQELEQYRHQQIRSERSAEGKLAEMKARKIELIKQIEEREKRCSLLEARMEKNLGRHNSSNIMVELGEKIRDLLTQDIDQGQQGSIYFLEKIENRLDIQLMIFDELDPEKTRKEKLENMSDEAKYLHQKFNVLERERRDRTRNEGLQLEKMLQEEKARKYNQRSKQPIHRKLGRFQMKKSKIMEKAIKKKAQEIPQELLDWREFLEDED